MTEKSRTEAAMGDIPKNLGGWAVTVARAKDVYWRERKFGKGENDALIAALDDALRD